MNEKWEQDKLDFQARMLMAYAEIEGMKAANETCAVMKILPKYSRSHFEDVLIRHNINPNSVSVYQGM